MVTVQIGSEVRSFRDADGRWIQQQSDRRTADGQSVCIRVVIKENDVDLIFATAGCGGSGRRDGPVPQFSAKENEVISEWRKHKLDQPEFPSGYVVDFLKALKRLLDL